MRKPPLTLAQLEAAKAAFDDGEPLRLISQRYGRSTEALRIALRKRLGWAPGRGAPGRSRNHSAALKTPLPLELMREDARRGLTLREIAARWHVAEAKLRPVVASGPAHVAVEQLPAVERRVTDLRDVLEREVLEPLRIPTRTDQERRGGRTWSQLENAAIAREIAAGRWVRARRGFSGLAAAAAASGTRKHPKSAAKAA